MKRVLIIYLILGTILTISAQETQSSGNFGSSLSSANSWATDAQMNDLRSAMDKRSLTRENAYANINGSPFLTDKKTSGYIVMNDGKIVQNVPIQYDLYAQAMLVKNKQGEEITLDNRLYKEIKLRVGRETLLFKKINPAEKDQFYQVLYENKEVLFAKQQQAILKEGRDQGVAQIEAEFFKKTTYFITQPNGFLTKVSLKKNKRDQFFSAFPAHLATSLKNYAKQHKIKLKKEEDFIALLTKAL